MKQTSITKLFLVNLTLFLLTASQISSQVTIGNSEAPEKGALLQLKNIAGITDGSANATKGFGMPRVALSDLDSLNGIEIENGDVATDYVGLLVYNTTLSSKICPGLHVWEGDKWEPLPQIKCFYIEADPKEIHFNIDETQKTTTLKWAPLTNSLSFNTINIGADGGLRNLTYTPSTTLGGEATLNITAQAMTTAETVVTPIIERITQLDVINMLPSNDIIKESIMIYQRNSGIDENKGANPLACSYRLDGKVHRFSMIAGGNWNVVVRSDPSNIISSMTNTSGSGNPAISTNFEFTLIDDVTTPQIYMADAVLTFKSSNGEFVDKDVTIKGVSYWPIGNLIVDYQDLPMQQLNNAKKTCADKGMWVAMPNDFTQIYNNKSSWSCDLYFNIGYEVATGDMQDYWGGDGEKQILETSFNLRTGKSRQFVTPYYNYSRVFRCVGNKK